MGIMNSGDWEKDKFTWRDHVLMWCITLVVVALVAAFLHHVGAL